MTHDAVPVLEEAKVPGAQASIAIGAVALSVLVIGLIVLDLAKFIAGQFAVSGWLGWLTVALVVSTSAVIVWSVMREWRGYASLGRTDRLREGLKSPDLATARQAAEEWLVAIDEDSASRQVISSVPDSATLRALLRSGPLTRLELQTSAAGRSAALQVLAATAVSPWPGLDGIIVVWRGFRLVRRVAQIHGLRPGTAGTLRLFHRLTMDAAGAAAADIAVSAVTEALLSSPVGGALAGQATGSAVAARRMLRLAFATAKSCRPI